MFWERFGATRQAGPWGGFGWPAELDKPGIGAAKTARQPTLSART
ncbi:hypothetical protein BLL52_2476 [Rhodoferax antarcticus ANT.BR]|uniref:Uncharacterized protein n=1 Tax=Rhodoferax antarcticus ANT.BR TaxID=1111071 RepID=A0A1Q8YE55_9BURK|nr:hypothetical protein BLL52_2476 [Rhodoferax antarcticus ANT.BR]